MLAERTASPPIAFLRFGRRAMATQFEVVLPFGTIDAEAAATDALDLIDQLESQLSIYRPTSEISRLNRIAGHAPVPVEPRLWELFLQARRLHAETNGAFDVTAGPLIRAWGFVDRTGRQPSAEQLAAARAAVGMDAVDFDSGRRSVQFRRPGMEVNLGSIGKGYALDRAAERLRRRIPSGLIQGGRSSVLGWGEADWSVGLAHPWQSRRIAAVRLRDRALGVSAATHQHFVAGERKFGHLIDPRTGEPAVGVALAAVLAPSAAEADALATAFYILGIEGARRYCVAHPEVSALILPEGDDAELTAVNFPPGAWRPDDAPLFDSD